MSNILSEDWILNEIKSNIRQKLINQVEDQVEEARSKMVATLLSEVDSIALELSRHYEVRSMGNKVVIEVHKDIRGGSSE